MPARELDALDTPLPFLEAHASPWLVRGLATLVIAICFTTIGAAAWIRIPQTVSSSFVLVPVGGGDPVRTPRDGVVARAVAIEGAHVREDSTLFVIRSEQIRDLSADLETQEARGRGAEEALSNERERHESRCRADAEERSRLDSRIANLERRLTLRREELALNRELKEGYRKLYDRAAGSRVQLATHELAVNKTELAIERLESDLDDTVSSRQKLDHQVDMRQAEHEETVRELEERVSTAQIRSSALRDDLDQSEGDELSLTAPCAGTVLRLQVRAVGTFVQSGEVLAEIACAEAPLRAELSIAPEDVARLEPGQPIKLLYDAFPYQRHGVRYGTLRWIGPAAIEVDGQRRFRGSADPSDAAIDIAGSPRPLRAGMGGTAKVIVDRRTLLAQAFEPLARLRESLSVPPAAPRVRPEEAAES